MTSSFARGVALATSLAVAAPPPTTFAQNLKPAAVAVEATATRFNIEQLDALLAPVALYPDPLLTQLLMASTFPLEVVSASRWLQADDNKKLKDDALAKALEGQNWDPSVKSIVPFPQVVAMLNDNLEWTQQLGYAVANQQSDVLDSIQRLRRQAQEAGSLKTTSQQRVEVTEQTIIIEPAALETIYVPSYQPSQVYGDWPYPETPPVYFPPSPVYYPTGYPYGAGLAFAAGVAITAGLWGWANPNWRNGNININSQRYNNINVGRPPINSGDWRPPAAGGPGGRPGRPPGGPVGGPARPGNLPANAIGRANVQIPGGAVNRPQIPGAGGQRPGGGQGLGGGRPSVGQGVGGGQGLGGGRPSVGQGVAGGQRPGGGGLPGAGQRPGTSQLPAGGQRLGGGQGLNGGQRPGGAQRPAAAAQQRPAGAFGGLGDGGRASQFGARGAQSRAIQQSSFSRGGGGGFQRGGGGGGGFRGGGGGRGGRR
jgi:Protein of unknown function (DUF3300)